MIGSATGMSAATGDVSRFADVEAAAGVCRDRYGGVDFVVANAGVGNYSLMSDGDPEAWREMLEVNVLALAVGSRAALRAMRACGVEGHIVNISSSASRLEAPGFYGATKAAVNAITASLRREAENDTIRVVTVIPGPTATNLARHQPDLLRGLAASLGAEIGPPSAGLFPPEALDRAAAAGQVLASADDVARAVLFAITQPIELSISEITVAPARRPAVQARAR